jgi:hypothetical protein
MYVRTVYTYIYIEYAVLSAPSNIYSQWEGHDTCHTFSASGFSPGMLSLYINIANFSRNMKQIFSFILVLRADRQNTLWIFAF